MTTEYFEIVYYSTGMTAQRKRIEDEAEARDTWAQMKADPWQGASSFRKITIIEENK